MIVRPRCRIRPTRRVGQRPAFRAQTVPNSGCAGRGRYSGRFAIGVNAVPASVGGQQCWRF